MGFNVYVNEDEIRNMESWHITENHDLYEKWNERLTEAWLAVSDAFIMPPPLLLSIVDEKSRPHCGEVSRGVFFQDVYQVDFESECLLVNSEFWQECGEDVPVFEMTKALAKAINSEQERIELLTEWRMQKRLHCIGVYPI